GAGTDRRGHRAVVRHRARGLAARPLVHRRTGPDVRLHRPHRRDLRPSHAPSKGGRLMSTYTIPNVIAQHPRGERIMDVYSHLLSERIIYLGTAIDAGVANALIAQLLFLESDNPDADIQFYI